MQMIEMPQSTYGAFAAALAAAGRSGEIVRARPYVNEKGESRVRVRTDLSLDEAMQIANGAEITNSTEHRKQEGSRMTEDAKTMQTMQTPPAEGISQISEGIHRMMGEFFGPSVAAVEARVAEIDGRLAAANADLKRTEEGIQERIEAALAGPEQLFQETLSALNRLEVRLTAHETATEAKFDEAKRDDGVLRERLAALVQGLRTLGKE